MKKALNMPVPFLAIILCRGRTRIGATHGGNLESRSAKSSRHDTGDDFRLDSAHCIPISGKIAW